MGAVGRAVRLIAGMALIREAALKTRQATGDGATTTALVASEIFLAAAAQWPGADNPAAVVQAIKQAAMLLDQL